MGGTKGGAAWLAGISALAGAAVFGELQQCSLAVGGEQGGWCAWLGSVDTEKL